MSDTLRRILDLALTRPVPTNATFAQIAALTEQAMRERDALEAENEQLREMAQLAVNGFRRWKRNQKRGGDRHEADHGFTDLGQAVWELDAILNPQSRETEETQ